MADLFSISKSGLSALEIALATTSHNISNVGTEGYSRQVVDFSTSTPNNEGGFFVGSGTTIGSIQRVYSAYIEEQLRVSDSRIASLSTAQDVSSQLDTLLANADTSVINSVNAFYAAANGLANNPSSQASREALLSQGHTLANQFRTLNQQLASMAQQNEKGIATTVKDISILTQGIAEANRQISSNNTISPDMLDNRDKLLRDLSKKVGITTFEQNDGAVNVFMSSGEALVVGAVATQFTSQQSLQDPDKVDISITTNSTSQRLDSNSITGGTLGGLISLRNGVIDDAVHLLGRIALGLSQQVNTQHSVGVDLNGNLGKAFFTDINNDRMAGNRVIPNRLNVGDARLQVTIQDVSQMSDTDYKLTFNGVGSYTLQNLKDGTSTLFGQLPKSIDGFTIESVPNTGALVGGDNFTISPTRYAARDIAVSLVDASAIATAAAVHADVPLTNRGNATLSNPQVVDITNAAFAHPKTLSPPIRIEFIDDRHYRLLNDTTGSVVQGGPIAYEPGLSNAVFPASAVNTGTSSGLVAAGSLPTLATGNLVLNGMTIAVPSDDGLSTSDASASALAIAKAINLSSSNHGVTAMTLPTTVNLGNFTPAVLTGTQFQINGQDIEVADGTQDGLLLAINQLSTTTGVVASVNDSGAMVLTAADGRNIQVTTSGSSGGATFANFSLTGAADDQVARAEVRLVSDEKDIALAGSSPNNAGFTAGTSTRYDPGYRFIMSGAAAAGDTFRITYNTDSPGDSSNMLAIAQTQPQNSFNNGVASLNDVYTQLIVRVGSNTAQLNLDKNTSVALQTQLQDKRDATSGVNLDEESVKLMKYEQAYKANAQAINIAKSLFDVIFQAMG